MSAAAAIRVQIDAEIAGANALTNFKTNDVTTFGPDPAALANEAIEQAHALAIVLSNILTENGDGGHVIRDAHLAKAMDSISFLTALAAFANQAAQA